ncbi:MAG: hypothetical protein INF84_12125 [Roseomonas sp.]|nr:hypothetical protein [Roseomonas sp.]
MSGVFINLGDGNDTGAASTDSNDTILGGNGNDAFGGLGGNDSLLGGDDNDSINGGNGDDTIYGGTGNDLLLAGTGNDRVFGEGGNDSFLADSTAGGAFAVYFDGGAGDDVFRLYGGAETVIDGGADTVIGGAGTDRVEFLAGNQTIDLADLGSDQASGIDHIVLAGTNQALRLSAADVLRLTDAGTLRVSGLGGNDVDLTGWVQGTSSGGFTSFTNGAATVLVADNLLSDVPGETRSGTESNDSTSLGLGSDSYLGLGGSDSVLGNGGNDTIDGGNGGDTIYGEAGDDSILGGDGDDRLYGGVGDDTIDAGSGTSDRVLYGDLASSDPVTVEISNSGSSSGFNRATVSTATQDTDSIMGFEILVTTTGNDFITVNSAATANNLLHLFANNGNDTIIVNTGDPAVLADYQHGSTLGGVTVDLQAGTAFDPFGTDSLVGVRGINGSDQNDIILGSGFNDRFRGRQGDDYMDGRGGADLVDYNYLGSSQAISVNLAEGRANDGQGGTDTLIGIEQVRGGLGNDTIIGGNGSELLRGNGGNDSIDGGNGIDIADYSNNASGQAISVNLLEGRANDGQGGTDTLSSIENVWGGAGSDTIIDGFGAGGVFGNAGNDSLLGGDGADTLDGGSGNDTISGGDGAGSLLGNAGDDVLAGGNANDIIYGGSGADSIAGGNGNDVIYGESGNDTIDGGVGTFDVIRYNVTGAEAITASISLLGPVRGGSNIATVSTATQGTDSAINFEYINATANNDTFFISGAATFYMSLFVFGSSGNDTIESSADLYGPYSNVFADYDAFSAANPTAGFTRGVSVDLQISNDSLGRPVGSATDYAGTDRLVGVRGIAATSLNDTIYGTAFEDRFRPYAGNDIVDGRDGFDMVDYGTNSSSQAVSVNFVTGLANDGRGGTDTLISIENARGGSGNDTLLGNVFSEAFRGLAGNDSIDGGLGSDRIEYFDPSATSGVSVNLVTGTASDGRGGIDSFTSIENAYGGELNDYLVGVGQQGQATSRLRGDAGSDTLVGIDGEFVVADYSSQTVGLSVNLASGSVNDGLGGVDQLVDIRGAIMFGNFADTVIGTAGNDWLSPGGGNDTVSGGNGLDIISYDGNPTGGVSVNLALGQASDGDGGTDSLSGIEGVWVSYSNDTVIGDGQGNLIGLGAGADSADAAAGQDTISYSLGFSPDTQVYVFNEAQNQLSFTGVTIDLAAGRATDYGGAADTILNFEAAIGSTMHDSILGSNGNDVLDGAEGSDTINGGGGGDTIYAGAGDVIHGGAGDDVVLVGNVTLAEINALFAQWQP